MKKIFGLLAIILALFATSCKKECDTQVIAKFTYEYVHPEPSLIGSGPYIETINFFNHSTKGASYLWDFGDGKTSTEENPTHIFSGNGTGPTEVHLTVTKGKVSATAFQSIWTYVTLIPM